ncbi:MAG: ATP-dependent DNA helicase RecG, partial [Rickettsiales bacterium]|nr:ATP-dependent DNA helicase RecG [Rickettsiales bacterium]
EKLIAIKSGRAKIIIGTHALISDDVEYKNLTLAVIDEQHRFGVQQRDALKNKGKFVDIIAMSATPIPRTLSMTMYGDMDVSVINEKPAGRLPIVTSKISSTRILELVERLKNKIAAGEKVFWVCPLVDETAESDYADAESRAKFLREHFADVGMVHGRMTKPARDEIMARFADKNSGMNILVSTTVIEVGIDVPSATIMVVENAERFGLSALHQLRGRVGRNDLQSFCILMFGNHITEIGAKRLDALCKTDDGFEIAETDLMLRGVGELLGIRQSGWIKYHFADPFSHRDIFKLANRDARELLDADPELKSDKGAFARQMIRIFNSADAEIKN